MIFRYGIVKGVAKRDPATNLGKGVLTPAKPKHYSTLLDPDKIGTLFKGNKWV